MWGGEGIRLSLTWAAGASEGRKPSRGIEQRHRVKIRAATVLLPRGTGSDLAPWEIGAAKPMSLERRRNNLPCVFLLL